MRSLLRFTLPLLAAFTLTTAAFAAESTPAAPAAKRPLSLDDFDAAQPRLTHAFPRRPLARLFLHAARRRRRINRARTSPPAANNACPSAPSRRPPPSPTKPTPTPRPPRAPSASRSPPTLHTSSPAPIPPKPTSPPPAKPRRSPTNAETRPPLSQPRHRQIHHRRLRQKLPSLHQEPASVALPYL